MEEPSNPQKTPKFLKNILTGTKGKLHGIDQETDKPNSVASAPASLNSDAGPSALKGDTMGSHMPE